MRSLIPFGIYPGFLDFITSGISVIFSGKDDQSKKVDVYRWFITPLNTIL